MTEDIPNKETIINFEPKSNSQSLIICH